MKSQQYHFLGRFTVEGTTYVPFFAVAKTGVWSNKGKRLRFGPHSDQWEGGYSTIGFVVGPWWLGLAMKKE